MVKSLHFAPISTLFLFSNKETLSRTCLIEFVLFAKK